MGFVTHPADTRFQTEGLYDSWAGAIFDAVNRFLGPQEDEETREEASMIPAHEPHDLDIGTWEPMPDGGDEPVGLLAYAVNPTDGRSILEMAELAKRVNARAGSPILFRIDYAPGQTCPQGDAQLDVFLDAVNAAFYPDFAGQVQNGEIIMSAFNEPNNPGEGSFPPGMVARAFNGRQDVPEGSFCSKVRADRNGGAKCLIAAPAPNCYGSDVAVIPPVPDGLEPSPWNQWAWEFWTRIKTNAAGDANWPSQFDIILLHAYTRYNMIPEGWPDLNQEPFANVRDSHGWRFGSNVTATWYETLLELKLDHLDIWISEYTSHIDDSWPSENYVAGTFPNFRDQALMTFGARLKAILWFVGPPQSPWERTAIYGGPASLRDDYNALRKLRR